MVEYLPCPACSSPVLTGQSFCAACGAALSGDTTGVIAAGATTGPDIGDTAASAEIVAGDTTAADADLRMIALGLVPATPIGPDRMAEAPAWVPTTAEATEPTSVVTTEPTPLVTSESDPQPGVDSSARIPGGYLPPSTGLAPPGWMLQPSSADPRQTGRSLSVSVGAVPVAPAGMTPSVAGTAAAPSRSESSGVWAAGAGVPAAEPAPFPTPFPASAKAAPMSLAESVASAAPPTSSATAPAAPGYPAQFGATAPTAHPATAAMATPPALDQPARKESTQALVAFGLIAAGSLIGMASLFLPWTTVNGIGVGTTGSTPPPNQWGWAMPAAIPLFLFSVLVLGAASGKDRAQERLPNLSIVIGRVTDLIMPMVLGGLYLGVFLLYVTLPWGCGSGVFGLLVGAGLLIAGAIVTLFSSEVGANRS